MPTPKISIQAIQFADPGSGHGGPKAKGVIANVRIDGDDKQITYWTDVSEKYSWITEIYHGYGQGQRGFTKSNAYVEGKGCPKKYKAIIGMLMVKYNEHFKGARKNPAYVSDNTRTSVLSMYHHSVGKPENRFKAQIRTHMDSVFADGGFKTKAAAKKWLNGYYSRGLLFGRSAFIVDTKTDTIVFEKHYD